MGALTAATVLGCAKLDRLKTVTFTAVLPASYDAGGSTLDLSTAGGLGALYGFTRVDTCVQGGVAAHASDVYRAMYVRAASGAAATGKIKVRDLGAAADAEASGDLSSHTLVFTATGE